MAKSQTAKKEEYMFIMQKVASISKLASTQVSFHPITKNNSDFEQIVPVFNNDKNYFTPSFVLKSDKSFFQGSISFQKLKFQERVNNSFQKNLPNNTSLASPNSNYCQICKCTFSQYLTHINNIEHQLANRKCSANQLILSLCSEYQINNKKTKIIKKMVQRRNESAPVQNNRILRSCQKKKKSLQQQQIGKNFSLVSTKVNTSQINAV